MVRDSNNVLADLLLWVVHVLVRLLRGVAADVNTILGWESERTLPRMLNARRPRRSWGLGIGGLDPPLAPVPLPVRATNRGLDSMDSR